MAKFKHPSKPEAGTAVPVEIEAPGDVLLRADADVATFSFVPPTVAVELLASIIATGIVTREKAGVEGVATRSVDYAEGILAEVKKRSRADVVRLATVDEVKQ